MSSYTLTAIHGAPSRRARRTPGPAGPALILLSALAALVVPATSAVAEPSVPIITSNRSDTITCVAAAQGSPISADAPRSWVSAEEPASPWPAARPLWQDALSIPDSARVAAAADWSGSSVVRWLDSHQRVLWDRNGERALLVTHAYEHVLLDAEGHVVSSRRGVLQTVVRVDSSTASTTGSLPGSTQGATVSHRLPSAG